MIVRYKKSKEERQTCSFNTQALWEINMYDDSASAADLDVFVNGKWKDMNQAFKDQDIIPNNHNTHFGLPDSKEARQRGWNDG